MISPCKIIDNFFSYKQKLPFCLIFLFFFTFKGYSQAIRADYKAYIDQYRTTALQHQQVFGIPASITLAQGLLESRAGKSGLAANGNNHFGIKDFNWRGEVMCYGDSTNMHCYRKYGAPEDSFLDHARFLKSKRYGKLYELNVTDYKAWAQGLRDCGYAEDPAYPQKLIDIIEQYRLHELDSIAACGMTPAAASATTAHNAKAGTKVESKADKQSSKQADKQAANRSKKEAQKLERERKQQQQLAHERQKKEHEQLLKKQREQELLAHEQQLRAQREQQRRERAERYAKRHANGNETSEVTEKARSARRAAVRAQRSANTSNITSFSSADND